jgi:hypothetical protein
MKPRTKVIRAIAVAGAGVSALVVAKLTVPFHYAERPIDPAAKAHILSIQTKGEQDPEVIAARYLFFGSDYQDASPKWLQVTSKNIDGNTVRVKVYNPRCEDDSVFSSIHRVYLHRDESQHWVPVRVEWSHRGRGRFGWTTEPTT